MATRRHKYKTPQGYFDHCVKCHAPYGSTSECIMDAKTWSKKIPHDFVNDDDKPFMVCRKCGLDKRDVVQRFIRDKGKKDYVWRVPYRSYSPFINTTEIEYHCPYTDEEAEVKDIIL